MYLKYLLIVVFMGCSFFSPVGAYFEQSLFCKISGTSIVVSLKPKSNEQRCQTILSRIDESVEESQYQISLATSYIKNAKDVLYRIRVRNELEALVVRLESSRKSIEQAMVVFEKGLFRDISKAVSYLVSQQEQIYIQRIRYLQQQIQTSSGDSSVYEQEILTINMILESVQKVVVARSFEDLVPPLKDFVSLRSSIAGK